MAKSKYETHVANNLFLIECWVRDGFTKDQIAERLNIGKTTFYRYINEHSELLELLKKGKEIVDYEVENALLKRALGYEYDEEKIEVHKNDKDELTFTKVTQVIKHVPPDPMAIMYWLNNRKRGIWQRNPVGDSTEAVIKELRQVLNKIDDNLDGNKTSE